MGPVNIVYAIERGKHIKGYKKCFSGFGDAHKNLKTEVKQEVLKKNQGPTGMQ